MPVKTIEIPNPELDGLPEDARSEVSEKMTYRLAQEPGAYVVLKIVRKVVKRADTGALSCPPAPPAVLEKSYADVSLLAGMLVDKFRYHLPLYRQHQRLAAAGITVSRASLTSWAARAIELLEPIYHAQIGLDPHEPGARDGRDADPRRPQGEGQDAHRVLLARLRGPGRGGLPVRVVAGQAARRGDPRRLLRHAALGRLRRLRALRASDGADLVHALCWVHARRGFVKAQDVEPVRAQKALDFIAALYEQEEEIRRRGLEGEAKLRARAEQSKPVVEAFFAWLEEELTRSALLPTNPFTKAAVYARQRRTGLEVFLSDPDVPLDTNHLERALRVIPMGRKNWLFCWTELGAQQVGADPEPAHHLRAPRRRSLHVPRRRAPAHRPPSPVAGPAAHAAAVEAALRRRAAAIPAPPRPAVESRAGRQPALNSAAGKNAEE